MPDIVTYNPNSTPVANRVVRLFRSIPDSEAASVAAPYSYLLNPVLPPGFPSGAWKVENDTITALTAEDNRAIAKSNLDSNRASRWFGKSPTSVLNETRFSDKL